MEVREDVPGSARGVDGSYIGLAGTIYIVVQVLSEAKEQLEAELNKMTLGKCTC